jgi:tetratricopeptide (TPR) repeat protein
MRREAFAALVVLSLAGGACAWDPAHPFDRDAPAVRRALTEFDAGDARAAAETLEEYLSTGACEDGKIGSPELLKKRPNGAYDLGLALFEVGETFGKRFGDEEEAPANNPDKERRAAQIECALRIVRAVVDNPAQPIELRARARYLEGNLLFLGARYEEAVSAYDESLRLSPGFADAGDPVARDAAYNRAIALKRIDDKKDAGQDAAKDGASEGGGGDGGGDSGGGSADAGRDSGGGKGGRDGGRDAAEDSGTQDDHGDAGQEPNTKQDAEAPPPKASQDDRMLDQLENAPTVQQESAKKNAQRRRVRGMADK